MEVLLTRNRRGTHSSIIVYAQCCNVADWRQRVIEW